MNTTLIEQIRNQILLAGTTTDVFYYHLPSDKYLDRLTVTYELNNTSNNATFEDKEAVKEYSLQININAPSITHFVNVAENIKSKVYGLNTVNSKVKSINLEDEDSFYDNDLKIFTLHLNFSIQYS